MAAADGPSQAEAIKRRQALPSKTRQGNTKKGRVATPEEAGAHSMQRRSAPAQHGAAFIKAEAAEAAPAGILRGPAIGRVGPATFQLPATVLAAAPEQAADRPVRGEAAALAPPASAHPAATIAAAVAAPEAACTDARAPAASARTPDTTRAAMTGGRAATDSAPDSLQDAGSSLASEALLLVSDSLAACTPARKEPPVPRAHGEQAEPFLLWQAASGNKGIILKSEAGGTRVLDHYSCTQHLG